MSNPKHQDPSTNILRKFGMCLLDIARRAQAGFLGFGILFLLCTSAHSAFLKPGLYRFNEGQGDYSVYIPTKNAHKMIVALHGSGERAEQYIQNWLKDAEENDYLLLVPNSFNKNYWSVDDIERVLVRTRFFQKEYDIKKTLLSGASAGGQFALYLGINHFEDFDGIATFMGTLMGGPSSSIEFQADPNKRVPIIMIHGLKDEMIPILNARLSKKFIEGQEYDVTLIEEEEMAHEHYQPANKKIIEWFEEI